MSGSARENRATGRALVVLDGEFAPALALVRRDRYATVLAADGALDGLLARDWLPDIVLGDFDSASDEALATARERGAQLVHTPQQEHTDAEKALMYLLARGVDAIDVIGHAGPRLDHTLASLFAAARFAERAAIRFLDPVAEGTVLPAGRSLAIRGRVGCLCSTIALLPGAFTANGFRWNVERRPVGGGVENSISNVVETDPATVRADEGVLFVYLHRRPPGRGPR